MNVLPDIPRLYTALAEWLACVICILTLRRRFSRVETTVCAVVWLVVLSVFLQVTGGVPLAWWIPCMAAAVGMMYGFLYLCCEVSALEAGYCLSGPFCSPSLPPAWNGRSIAFSGGRAVPGHPGRCCCLG